MTHASIFSGIGGPEVAAEMLGWDNLFHCEINPFGRKILDYWFPNSKSYEDVTKTEFTEWRGKINVLTAGFPCQPFSLAGQRRGEKDDRYLWPYVYKCIGEIQPDWIVAENVAGILTMVEQGEVTEVEKERTLFNEDNPVHRYECRGTFTLERICKDLETHGYSVQPVLIPACAVGAPHRRDRVYIIGHRNTAPYSSDSGSESVRQERQDKIHRLGSSADPKVEQSERFGPEQSEISEQKKIELGGGSCENCSKWVSADACHTGLQEEGSELETTGARRCDIREGEWYEVGERWKCFPTVSPVHRGNDGLPFDVDDLAIPFGKWRTESLKAYGNAIVPQVMYEIFRAIQIVEGTANDIKA